MFTAAKLKDEEILSGFLAREERAIGDSPTTYVPKWISTDCGAISLHINNPTY